jgi:hypothetical protein
VKKVEALVYIYTNNQSLRQRTGVGPVRYYDDNIILKDFSHGVEHFPTRSTTTPMTTVTKAMAAMIEMLLIK